MRWKRGSGIGWICGYLALCIGRKNWLFSNCPRGAKANAIVYSVIQSAKTNGLDTYKYLAFLLRMLPAANESKDSNTQERYALWVNLAMDACKL